MKIWKDRNLYPTKKPGYLSEKKIAKNLIQEKIESGKNPQKTINTGRRKCKWERSKTKMAPDQQQQE